MASRSGAQFGELLKQGRLARGLSQETLAERARISASAIGALERGARRAPYRDTVALLAAALELADVDRAELEAAAERARGRQSRTDAEAPGPHTLPTRLTSFLGRDSEMADIEALLESHRLVTITGSGGIGKTRMAVEVAQRLLSDQQNEAWFVDFSPIDEGALVAGTIAATLNIPLTQGADSAGFLATKLKARELLLILDNCEHVIEDAALMAGLILRSCPGIRMIATSRERLAIDGERAYRLPSLPVPENNPQSVAEACSYASFRLFMERATAIEPNLIFDAARLRASAEICRQLEGIPLALELAASRLSTLGMTALTRGLKEHFVLTNVARDVPQRQRTMNATVAWSYDLLSEPECLLFRRLAIFRGGMTLEAAETVCADGQLPAGAIPDTMSLLVEKSLLSARMGDQHGRYYTLESVRAFALKKLGEADEVAPMARALLHWLSAVADRGHDRYSKVSARLWQAEFGAELDNIRPAIDWAISSDSEDDALAGARIVGGLRGLWTSTNRHSECRRWTTALVDRVDQQKFPVIASRLLAAHIQVIHGAAVVTIAEQAIPVFERAGDRLSLISLHAHIAWIQGIRSEFDEAEKAIARAFALAESEGIHHSRRYINLLEMRAAIRARARRTNDARKDLAEAVLLRRVVGEQDVINLNLEWNAYIEFLDGNLAKSAELHEAAVDYYRNHWNHSDNPPDMLNALAGVRLALGDLHRAESAVRESLELAAFEPHIVWLAIWHLAPIAALRGHHRAAARLFGFAMAAGERERSKPLEDAIQRSSYDILMTSLREQLPPTAIAALQSQGAELDLEHALEEAFELCGIMHPLEESSAQT
jgi:predicted ATPase/DNA-binding XRE family transcriptional regulator